MKKEKNNLAFCFKKTDGLKLISPNDNLAKVYKRKSKSALNMLESAKEKQENEWILDTSYYAKYFIIYSLFMQAGIKSKIHDCTIFALKYLFVDLGIVSEDIYEELLKSKELRVGSLYYDKDFGKDEILKRARTTTNFCLKVESILENFSKEDIVKVRNKFEELKGKE